MTDLFADKNKDMPEIRLYTDGGCIGNPGPGGWAYVIKDMNGILIRENSAPVPDTTNNRMELQAVIEALSSLNKPHKVHLIGDSQYVLKGISEWMAGWKKRGWRKSDKKPVLNSDQWKQLDQLTQKHTVLVEWVKGHAGHPENERCDELANGAAHSIA